MNTKFIADIIGWIDPGEYEDIKELSRRVCESSASNEKRGNLIGELHERLGEDFADPSFEKAPFYNLFLACLCFSPESADSIKYAERAENQFTIQGKKWNQVISTWMAGQILYLNGRLERAREKTGAALEHLSILEKAHSIYGLYIENINCVEVHGNICDLVDQIDRAFSQPKQQEYRESKKKASLNPKGPGLEGYLSFPFIRVLERVQAGVDGPIWSDSSAKYGYTQANQIEINNKKYSLFSVTSGDKQIQMEPKRKYAWAFVNGNSMNNTKPTPIEQDDAVLFYPAADAPSNSLVIASRMDQSGAGNKYMVKRWDAGNKLFLSSSTEPGHEPTPLDEEHTIMGIVVCVAKILSDQ